MFDDVFHNVFRANARFVPPPAPVVCRKCGDHLKVYYAESRLYAVRCGYCESISLVHAKSPMVAVLHFGVLEDAPSGGLKWIVHCNAPGNRGTSWTECPVCATIGSPEWKLCPVCETKLGG